ncbi:MAG TPA: hypothetical protein VFQ45_05400 [Longimicrobium sp.]|nr:hypothetical protein [Longimicrobium sp.]
MPPNPNNVELANALRTALGTIGMTATDINTAIGGSLHEASIASTYGTQVGNIAGNPAAFATAIDGAATGLGATWTAPVYNLTPLNLTPGVKLPATEELSAIRTHSGSAAFDPAKALTNMLRIIKVAET